MTRKAHAARNWGIILIEAGIACIAIVVTIGAIAATISSW